MSSLIKAGAAGALVRPLGPPSLASAASAPTEFAGSAVPNLAAAVSGIPADRAEALDRQCLELEATIAQLRRRLADAEGEAEEREDAAFAKGRTEGLALASGEEDKRIEALADGMDQLVQAQAGPLAECEMLALQLTRAALGRLFGDESLHSQLIEATIANQLARIGQELVLSVAVSPLDFGSDEALARVAARFNGVALMRDDALPAGGCVAKLRLGRVDLSLPSQWQALCDHFEQIAREDPRA